MNGVNVRKEYEQAYRAFRKFWKMVDNLPANASMRGANAYYMNVCCSYVPTICNFALESIKEKRNYDYKIDNPLWCDKWTFPNRKQP